MNQPPKSHGLGANNQNKFRLRLLGCWLAAGLLLPQVGLAQINIWTNPASANWQDPYWSLGMRPNSLQSAIYFTNAEWKAVQINADTATIYPGSLTISNLFLGGPLGTSNTLLLNYAGFDRALRVIDQLRVGTNAALRTLASRLDINKQLKVDGAVYHEVDSQVTCNQVNIGPDTGAAYVLESGSVTATAENVGGTNYTQALFSQGGGTNRSGSLRVHARARYDLSAGSLRAGNLMVGDGPTLFQTVELAGAFTQSGGSVFVTNDLRLGEPGQGSGTYRLSAGNLSADQLRIGISNSGTGFFEQIGGTNQCRVLILSEGDNNPWTLPDPYTYSAFFLGNGRLNTAQSQLGSGRPCYFTQTGGVHEVSTSLVLSDGQLSHSYYSLAGGLTHCQSMQIESSEFYHSAGTNRVTTTLDIQGGSSYELSSGSLFADSTSISRLQFDHYFLQSGGLHFATNSLYVGYSPTNTSTGDRYIMSGGQLTTATIWLWGIFEHRGGNLSPANLFMYGGRWIAGSSQQFHQLDPRGGVEVVSTIVMATNPCVLRFDSSWYPDWLGTLTIEQWSGAANGGGSHQIRFGDNASGLSSGHLQHTWFVNPLGFEPGLYQARILATGEIVPGPKLKLFSSRIAGQLVLSWDTAATSLLSATNVNGPYLPVQSAQSPFTNSFTDKVRFFRLHW